MKHSGDGLETNRSIIHKQLSFEVGYLAGRSTLIGQEHIYNQIQSFQAICSVFHSSATSSGSSSVHFFSGSVLTSHFKGSPHLDLGIGPKRTMLALRLRGLELNFGVPSAARASRAREELPSGAWPGPRKWRSWRAPWRCRAAGRIRTAAKTGNPLLGQKKIEGSLPELMDFRLLGVGRPFLWQAESGGTCFWPIKSGSGRRNSGMWVKKGGELGNCASFSRHLIPFGSFLFFVFLTWCLVMKVMKDALPLLPHVCC